MAKVLPEISPELADWLGRQHIFFVATAPRAAVFPPHPGTRALIRVEVTRVSTSCGYSVPLFDHRGHRDMLDKWAATKGPDGLCDYRAQKNARSLDGLPALPL